MSEPKIVEKKWGREVILHNDTDYCCKLLVYEKQIASSQHYHKYKHETFTVLSGRFYIEWGTKKEPASLGARTFTAGAALVLEPGTVHRVRCLQAPGIIVEASSQDDPDDCVRLIPSEE